MNEGNVVGLCLLMAEVCFICWMVASRVFKRQEQKVRAEYDRLVQQDEEWFQQQLDQMKETNDDPNE